MIRDLIMFSVNSFGFLIYSICTYEKFVISINLRFYRICHYLVTFMVLYFKSSFHFNSHIYNKTLRHT